MPYTKWILCLAASRKGGGYCYAGKDLKTGRWIRPVSSREDQEISDLESTTSDRTRAKVLDVLQIPLVRPVPSGCQTENHLIEPAKRWTKVTEFNWQHVQPFVDDHDGTLWANEDASAGFSYNRVKQGNLHLFDHSLVLIRPTELIITVGPKGGSYPGSQRRVVKAGFVHAGQPYVLAVTDPMIEARFRRDPDRTEDMTGALLCVSLGEVYGGHAYKLVAAVIEPPES